MKVVYFFNDTATTEIYTLSLHDALPISLPAPEDHREFDELAVGWALHALEPEDETVFSAHLATCARCADTVAERSEEHTSELQSRQYLVCRLLLEKKKTNTTTTTTHIRA